MKKILSFFSYFFHPIFTAVFASLLYFTSCQKHFDYQIIYLYLLQILLLTVFIPLGFFYFLIAMGKIDSIMVTKVSQRKIPLVIHIVLLVVLIKKSITVENIPELYYFLLGCLVSSLMALVLVYFNIKSSLHMLGIAGLTIFYIGLNLHFNLQNYFGIVLILLCNGLVASSRLQMKAHNYKELFLGYLVGIIPQTFLLWYWL